MSFFKNIWYSRYYFLYSCDHFWSHIYQTFIFSGQQWQDFLPARQIPGKGKNLFLRLDLRLGLKVVAMTFILGKTCSHRKILSCGWKYLVLSICVIFPLERVKPVVCASESQRERERESLLCFGSPEWCHAIAGCINNNGFGRDFWWTQRVDVVLFTTISINIIIIIINISCWLVDTTQQLHAPKSDSEHN